MGILRLRICSAALAAALTLGAAAGPPVKKSETGVCLPVTSPYYQRTTRFVPYSSMAECMASGGHILKRGEREPKPVDPLRRAVDWTADHALKLIAIAVAAVMLYQGVRRAVRRWRNRKPERESADRERERQEEHRRETLRAQPPREAQPPVVHSDDDAVFKHRRHRRDPWLKVLGYFKR